ncbi:MAG: ankyrin repeat domain-containing protein [Planctomycetia bacterium]|nr:ankyrin repeat domain-containing protein [Planctomycetia bacterium]
MLLIEKNEADKVRLILEHDDGSNAKFVMSNGWTPAFTAVKMGNLEVLKMLLEKGANLQTTAIDGMNLLQYACFKGNREIVQFLLEKGLNPNMRGTNNTPAYFYSCGKPEILKMMLKHGADVSLRNNVKGTAMHFAAANGALESVRLLVEAGADANAKDNNGETPQVIARAGGFKAVVEYFKNLTSKE